MGRIIAVEIITAIEFLLLSSGFYIYLFGIHACIHRLDSCLKKGWGLGIAVNLCIITALAILGCPVMLTMMILYVATMLRLRKEKVLMYQVVLRGMQNLILQLAFQLGLCFLLHWRWAGYSDGSFFEIQRNTQYIVLVWMLMFQILLLIFNEERNMKMEKWRRLHVVLGTKKLLEGIWFYHLIETPDMDTESMVIFCTFLAVILLDYLVIREIELLRTTYREKIRRVTTPMNRDEYYTRMEEEHLQIRRMFHDMKNQLMILEGQKEEQSEYLQDFVKKSREQIEGIASFFHTGNTELNMLLYESKKRAENNHIDFQCIFQEGCLDFMEQEDINAIFINAIMNAIEACMKMKEGERKLQIQAGEHLNDVVLSFRNTYEPEDTEEGLSTSKKDKKHHGFGIPNIQRAADKYKGYVSVSKDHQIFQLMILFVKE